MCPKDASGMSKQVASDQTAHSGVNIVYSDLSVQKLENYYGRINFNEIILRIKNLSSVCQ